MSLMRVMTVVIIAWYAPRLFFAYRRAFSDKTSIDYAQQTSISSYAIHTDLRSLIPGTHVRYGLVTSAAAPASYVERTLEACKRQECDVKALFYLQTSMRSIPIESRALSLLVRPLGCSSLDDIDVLLLDFPDCFPLDTALIAGSLHMVELASQLHKKIIILDRAAMAQISAKSYTNVLQDMKLAHLVHDARMYRMTLGEFIRYFNEYEISQPADIRVIPLSRFDRQYHARTHMLAERDFLITLLAHIHPLMIQASSIVSVPRSYGITRAQWHELRLKLAKLGVKTAFIQNMQAHDHDIVEGLKIVRFEEQASSMGILLVMINFFKEVGVKLTCSEMMDVCVGNSLVRAYVHGKIPKQDLEDQLNKSFKQFLLKAQSVLLYKPYTASLVV